MEDQHGFRARNGPGQVGGFSDYVEGNPVILGLESRFVWEGHSSQNTTHIGTYSLAGNRIDRDTCHYTFSYGGSTEVQEAIGFEGLTDQVVMVLGDMGACLSNNIGLNAPRNGIDLGGMEIFMWTDVDPSILFEVKGPYQHASCILNITCEAKVKGNLTDDQLRTIGRLIEYSPDNRMVSHPSSITSKVSKS